MRRIRTRRLLACAVLAGLAHAGVDDSPWIGPIRLLAATGPDGRGNSAQSVAPDAASIAVVRPPADEPLFGLVTVEVEVSSAAPVAAVELWLDGVRVGQRAEAPWLFRIDVGQENRERQFEVVARTVGGDEARAAWIAPSIAVDEVVELDLQQLYVTVTDERGRRLLDLPRGAFEVRDEGERQELVTFASGEIPFTTTLLVDASWSMRGAALDVALRGVGVFVDRMAENDRSQVVLYDDQVRLATGFHDRAAPLHDALAAVEAGEGSAILDRLFVALLELERQQGRRVIVLLSDGRDLHSVVRADDLEGVARSSQAILYWVRLAPPRPRAIGAGRRLVQRAVPLSAWRDSSDFRRQERQLETLVRRSGGRIYELVDSAGVEPAFGDILRELREQYALGYYPTPRRNDGSWRRVRVSVAHPGARLRVREGYVDR